MDIEGMIRGALEGLGCRVAEAGGIWYVREPGGRVWSMTTPMVEARVPDEALEEFAARDREVT